MATENNMNEGIVFKSATSGLWYQNKDAAGEVSAVRVDGVLFVHAKPEQIERSNMMSSALADEI